jgi:hypothetical protein
MERLTSESPFSSTPRASFLLLRNRQRKEPIGYIHHKDRPHAPPRIGQAFAAISSEIPSATIGKSGMDREIAVGTRHRLKACFR